MNYYSESWSLYKAHSESFADDFKYYTNLCSGKRTLEIFAGFGRLSNFLIQNGIDLETVELEPEFAKYINLPSDKNHIEDVLRFNTNKKFEVIIGAYNSFCLFLKDDEITRFFKTMDSLLVSGGVLSLSYYPLKSWVSSSDSVVNCDGVSYVARSYFDFSLLDQGIATWIDEYKSGANTITYRYPTRVYSDDNDLLQYIHGTNLQLKEKVINYNMEIVTEEWVEYVFIKR